MFYETGLSNRHLLFVQFIANQQNWTVLIHARNVYVIALNKLLSSRNMVAPNSEYLAICSSLYVRRQRVVSVPSNEVITCLMQSSSVFIG